VSEETGNVSIAIDGQFINIDTQDHLIQYLKNKTFFKIHIDNEILNIEIPFIDTASVENVTSCVLTILAVKAFLLSEKYPSEVLGLDPSVSRILSEQYKNKVLEKLRHLDPVAMRLELKAGINGCLVVNDAYNLDFNSLQIALDFIGQQSRQLKRTVILSDILQSGQEADILYKKVADVLLEKGISKVMCIGQNISKMGKYISPQIKSAYFDTTDDLLKELKNSDFNHEIVLLKGARPFTFERIAERLSLKSHKTVLEINLNALTHNLAFFKSLLQAKGHQPKTGLMAMVKASAYGNGSEEVARLLEFHKVEYLAVAYSDEGIELRNAGVRMPIMVMNPEEESFDALKRYNLEPEIYSLNILKRFIDFSQDTEVEIAFRIHLKLDTGMHRLGFEKSDIVELIRLLKANQHITIASIFTHLAASEATEHDHFTDQQVKQFMDMYEQITQGFDYKPMRHVLNSSGITRHPQYRFEMVRLGIGLYGIDSNGAFQNQLQVVQTLKASISQIKNVPQSETIGYSRRGVLTRDSRIATISIGYADGLLRGCGNGQFSVYLKEQKAPIVGNVCMDMTMIDVTDIPEAAEGDEVEIFGSHIPVQELAAVLNTIPYQIFTGISERVKRVYFQE
jgi:alanine racemase